MENNSNRQKELETGDRECSERNKGEERKGKEQMTVTMATSPLTPGQQQENNKN